MIIRTLGHGELARNLGGFPTGYLQVADKLNLFKNTTIDITNGDKPAIRGEFAVLLLNAMRMQVYGEEDFYWWDKYFRAMGANPDVLFRTQATFVGVEHRNQRPEECCVDFYRPYIQFLIENEIIELEWRFSNRDLSHMIGEEVIIWVSCWNNPSIIDMIPLNKD